MNKNTAKNIDDYIDRFPKDVQRLLKQLRATVKKTAPQAQEKISYAMPAFALNGILVYFAAYQSHIGFYPGAAAILSFKKDIQKFKSSKGTIQFPLDKPLPLALVVRIVKYRVQQNLQKKKRP